MDMETAAEFSLHPLLSRTSFTTEIKNQGVLQFVFHSILLVGVITMEGNTGHLYDLKL